MRPNLMAALALCVLAVPACKKSETKPEAAAPPPAVEAAPPVAPVEPPAAPAVDDTPNDMKNCPNAVAGAETKIDMSKTTVTVTIAAKDEAGAKDVQTRAHALLDSAPPAGGEIKHTGERTGGGALGKCPVVVADATAAVKDTKTGVEITYTPASPKKPAEVASAIQGRLDAWPKDGAAAGGGGGGGGNGGGDGSGGGHGGGHGGGAHGAAADPAGGAAAPSGEGAAKANAEDKAEGGR